MGLVYRALFPSGKSYIGMTTKSLQIRINQHHCHQKSANNHFANAINKYGFKSIVWEVLEDNINNDKLPDSEKYYIQKHNTYRKGYNSTSGGEISYTFDPLVRQKMKDNHTRSWLGRCHSKETKQKMSRNSRRLSRPHTKEEKRMHSKRMLGQNNPMFGKTHSQSARNKISQAAKLRIGSKNPNAKLSTADRLEIIKLYRLGESAKLIGQRYQVTKQTIYNVLKDGD